MLTCRTVDFSESPLQRLNRILVHFHLERPAATQELQDNVEEILQQHDLRKLYSLA